MERDMVVVIIIIIIIMNKQGEREGEWREGQLECAIKAEDGHANGGQLG